MSWLVLVTALTVVIADGWSFPTAALLGGTVGQALIALASSAKEARPTNSKQTAEASDSIGEFANDLKSRLLNGRFRTVKSFANNHSVTGLSRTTVYSAISGARLPTEATVRNLLCTVAVADDPEIRSWLDRRDDLETQGQTDDHVALGTSAGRARLVFVGLAVVTAVVVIAAVTTREHQPVSPSAAPPASAQSSAQACTPLADLRPHQVAARVANTQGQGTFPRIQPQQNCHTGFLAEKDPVTVVCQDLNGPTVTDVYDGAVRDWSVWDKLASGAYVSDLYLDLPKNAQPALVAGLPSC